MVVFIFFKNAPSKTYHRICAVSAEDVCKICLSCNSASRKNKTNYNNQTQSAFSEIGLFNSNKIVANRTFNIPKNQGTIKSFPLKGACGF